MTQPNITLAGIADGAAEELFQAALRAAISNADDLNTDWKKKREIVLKFTLTTDEGRRTGVLDIACTTKLAPVKSIGANVYIGRSKGQLAMVEALHQEDMFQEPVGAPAAVQNSEAH